MAVPHVDVETALGGGRVRAEVARVEEGARVRAAQVRLKHCAVRGVECALAVEARIFVRVPPPVVVVLPLKRKKIFQKFATELQEHYLHRYICQMAF